MFACKLVFCSVIISVLYNVVMISEGLPQKVSVTELSITEGEESFRYVGEQIPANCTAYYNCCDKTNDGTEDCFKWCVKKVTCNKRLVIVRVPSYVEIASDLPILDDAQSTSSAIIPTISAITSSTSIPPTTMPSAPTSPTSIPSTPMSTTEMQSAPTAPTPSTTIPVAPTSLASMPSEPLSPTSAPSTTVSSTSVPSMTSTPVSSTVPTSLILSTAEPSSSTEAHRAIHQPKLGIKAVQVIDIPCVSGSLPDRRGRCREVW